MSDNKKLRDIKIGMSGMGYNYGEIHPQYGGVVMDITTLPDGTYFEVSNGCWIGYIDTDEEGRRIIYTGVDKESEDPTKSYVNKIVLKDGEHYAAAIDDVFVKDIIKTSVSKIRKLRFNPMTTDIRELNQALDAISEHHKQEYNLKAFIMGQIDDLTDSNGNVNAAALKECINDLYEKEVSQT